MVIIPTLGQSIVLSYIYRKSIEFKFNMEFLKTFTSKVISFLLLRFIVISMQFFSIFIIVTIILLITNQIGIVGKSSIFPPTINLSIESNQLSLAGIFFTLAMGGTIVFSLMERHNKFSYLKIN